MQADSPGTQGACEAVDRSTGAPYVAETTSVEVAGDVAFANWFHLLRCDDGVWRIVGKLITTRDEAGEG